MFVVDLVTETNYWGIYSASMSLPIIRESWNVLVRAHVEGPQ